MKASRPLAVALVFGVFAVPAAAQAQNKSETQTAYTYHFDDDDLLGDTLSTPPPLLSGGHRARRIMLLRPRASFVAEMLESVDSL